MEEKLGKRSEGEEGGGGVLERGREADDECLGWYNGGEGGYL